MDAVIFGPDREQIRRLLGPLLPRAKFRTEPGETDAVCLRAQPDRAVLIGPGTDEALLARFPEACVVSCGLSGRDSVSCSSFGGRVSVCVRRELPVAGGGSVCEQELRLDLPPDADVSVLLLCTAACLCAGLRPEEIRF